MFTLESELTYTLLAGSLYLCKISTVIKLAKVE